MYFTEPKRAGTAIITDDGPRSYDAGWADASVDHPASSVLARRTADGLIVQWDPTEDNGAEVALGVFRNATIIGTPGATKRVTWAFQEAEIDFAELVLPEDVDLEDVRAALPKLTIRG